MTRNFTLCFLATLLAAFTLHAARKDGPTTRLDVTSHPAGATVLIDHQERGVTPLTLTDLAPGPHLVQLTKDGCRDAFESVSLELGVVRTVGARLEPLTGILLVTSDPPACDVAVKGVSLGSTPLLITTLESGVHRLTVSSPGYQTKEIDVTLEGRTPIKQEVTLLSDSGTMALTSDPEGAEVLINGIARGRTPCRIDRIPGGTVTVKIQAEGFQPHTREISLAAGEVQNVDVRLTPLPGTLRVVSIPEGARVYIDDEYKGDTPFDLKNAEPKTYRVRVERAGHEPLARDVTLAKAASITEEFRLSKITGRLEIITAPSRATVLISGKKVGITSTHGTDSTAVSDPFAVEEVLEGEHEVEIFRKGYTSQKRRITVKRGETQTLQFKLERQFIPNYEVVTGRAHYKGVLEFMNEEGIHLEIMPGISQTIPMKDVKKHGPLTETE
ncbi:MAG TPA: PEGA domain-containing protein [Kiritimatiellia bacterium]|nr:PEGA domain-containing protein [Kiritimatiellia bacterium]